MTTPATMKSLCLISACLVLGACARRESNPLPVASANAVKTASFTEARVVAAPSVVAPPEISVTARQALDPAPRPRTGCEAFDPGEEASEANDEARAIAKAKSIYSDVVYRRKLDDRAISKHPGIVQWNGFGSGENTRDCVASNAKFVVFGKLESIALDREYESTSLEFNDAADGESAYTFFVERATGKVRVILSYSNFQP